MTVVDPRPEDARTEATRPPTVADLGAVATTSADGAVWSLPHDGDLDANLVHLGPHAEIGEHRNRELDVMLFVHAGHGDLVVDGVRHAMTGGWVALVPRGCLRSIRAGARGLTYLSVHRHRGGLRLDSPRRPTAPASDHGRRDRVAPREE
jgi:hypothetical protein